MFQSLIMTTAPRWKTALAKAIAEHPKSVVIQLASADPASARPFVRSHIFREFLAPLSNPSLPLLVSTTDIRSPKTAQIIPNPRVEVAWWIEGTQEQFRISGLACIIPTSSNDLYKNFVHLTGKNAPRGSALATLSAEGFDWEAKRREVWGKLSGYMKAAWCRPVPGSRLDEPGQATTWPEKIEEPKEGDDEKTRQNWATALENFALVVIEPEEVDYLELGTSPDRRTKFWRMSDGSWNSEALVP